ncbi:MAG: helix-turn-helix transcriptional regulator [Bacteroidales bacterium]|nr:helix-turn-helix transcriptional regulator [Bacteroidales bacterium]
MYNGKKVSTLIEKLRLKQSEVSKGCGISHSTLTGGMLADKCNPTAEKIIKLADYLQVPIDEFFIRSVEIDYIAYYTNANKQQKSSAAKDKIINSKNLQEKYIAQIEESLRRANDELDRKQLLIDMYQRGEIVVVRNKSNSDFENIG